MHQHRRLQLLLSAVHCHVDVGHRGEDAQQRVATRSEHFLSCTGCCEIERVGYYTRARGPSLRQGHAGVPVAVWEFVSTPGIDH